MAKRKRAPTAAAARHRLTTELAKLEAEVAALGDEQERRRPSLEDLAVRLRALTWAAYGDAQLTARLRPMRAALGAAVREAADTTAPPGARSVAPASPRAGDATSDDVAVRLAMALHDPFSCDITVSCHTDAVRLRADVERAVGRRPFCVAWLPVISTSLARRLADDGWNLWRPDADVESRKRSGLVAPEALPLHGVLVATMRRPEINEFARLTATAAVRLASDAGSVVLRADQCSGEEYRRRNEMLERSHRLRRSSPIGSGRPQLATCAGCGRPLTDPESARRGYGPVGCAKATGTRNPAPVRNGGASALDIAGISLAQWQIEVRRRLPVP